MRGSRPPDKPDKPNKPKIVEIDAVEVRPATQNVRPDAPPPPAQDLTLNPDIPLTTDKSFVPSVAEFGHTILSSAFRFIKPTWRNYIMYVDAEARTGNEDANRFHEAWKSLTTFERVTWFPEQLCTLANVKPEVLFGWVSKHALFSNTAESSMALSFLRTNVVEATAGYAIDSPDNYKDRELFLRAAGALPQASGGRAVTFMNAPVVSSSSVALSGSRSESSPVDKSGLKDMDSEIVDLAKIMQSTDTTVVTRAEQVPNDPDEEEEDEDDDERD